MPLVAGTGFRARDWRRFGAPSLKAFALEQPLEVADGDRMLPDRVKAAGTDIETTACR
jgi:hypothetical protein